MHHTRHWIVSGLAAALAAFALTAPAVGAGSLRVGDVVAAQRGLWFGLWMPVAFAVFCAAGVAFSVWGPFGAALGVPGAGGVPGPLAGLRRWVGAGAVL